MTPTRNLDWFTPRQVGALAIYLLNKAPGKDMPAAAFRPGPPDSRLTGRMERVGAATTESSGATMTRALTKSTRCKECNVRLDGGSYCWNCGTKLGVTPAPAVGADIEPQGSRAVSTKVGMLHVDLMGGQTPEEEAFRLALVALLKSKKYPVGYDFPRAKITVNQMHMVPFPVDWSPMAMNSIINMTWHPAAAGPEKLRIEDSDDDVIEAAARDVVEQLTIEKES